MGGLLVPLKQIISQNQDLQLVQGNIIDALKPLDATPFAGGNFLTSVALTSGGDNLIEHGLGRVPQIFVVANLDSDARVWSPTSAQLNGARWDRRVINLRCSSNCTISLWVN